ncbi:unnamed protein product [Arabidopsis thaliana]|uniref:(thale cress) hypothetical protein n=1 Tax=Arabidopsis thaliana TaxID=3702 RepID=A0A7G2EUV5_ARATH|nr:unnamed protein product [Arabidopsis thaliana]
MEKQAHKKFCWIIKNFSPQSERLYSVPVLIGDCKWRLIAYPIRDKYFSLCLQVISISDYLHYLDVMLLKQITVLTKSVPLGVFQFQKGFPYANFRLNFINISGKASELLTKKIRNDGNESGDLLKKTSPEKESNHVNESKPESFITPTEKQVGQKFVWVIKNFSFSNSEKCYSDPFVIRGFKWRLLAEYDLVSLYLHLCLPDSQLFPSEVVKARLTIVNQLFEKLSISKESEHCFDEQNPTLGYTFPYELLVEDGGFLVNEDLMIIVEVIGASDVFEDSSTQGKVDVNGFQVLPSQVEYVRSIFERHPDIAVEFRAKNQHLRTSCMIFLLSLIETLCQSLEELSNEDLVEADIALTYVKDAGFKVDWLEKKLDQVKEKKEKELSDMVQLQEMEDHLLKLKQSCSDLDDLVVKKKDELSVTRSPLSFDDVDWLEKKLDQVKDKKEREQSGLARLHELEEYLLKLKQKCSNLDLLVEKENVELSATRTPMSFNDVV